MTQGIARQERDASWCLTDWGPQTWPLPWPARTVGCSLATTGSAFVVTRRPSPCARGNLPAADDTLRFAQTDRSLAMLERNRAELDSAQPKFPLCFARPVRPADNLHNRYQMADVTRGYEELVAEGVIIPNYVMSAAADAYLYLHKPEQAEPLYRHILITQPSDLNVNIGLFYTLIELEQFDAAYKLIDQLDQNKLRWLEISRPGDRRSLRPNPDKVTTATTAAMARFYGEQSAG